MSRWPTKPQCRQLQVRPAGFFFQSHRGQWLLVPRSTFTKAHDADLGTLLLKIVFVLAVFPLTHALVVMALFVLVAHPVRIAHVERLGSGSLEQDGPLCIGAMEEEEQARLMHQHRLGKGERHAHKTGQRLS
jgi:hypothetical protein